MKRIIRNPIYALGILFLLWVIVQLVLWENTGIKIANDSAVYIHHAHNLADLGSFPKGKNLWYSGYIVFLAGFFLVGLSFPAIIIFQTILSGLSVFALYHSTLLITKHQYATAFIAGALYALWPKIHLWNFYILTESLFTSMGIFSFWTLVQMKNWRQLPILLPVLIFTFLIRPNGVVLLVAVLVFGYVYIWNHHRKLATKLVLLTLPFVIMLGFFLLNKMLSSFYLIETYSRGEIIFLYKGILIEGGGSLNLPDADYPPLIKLLYFVFHHPIYFMKLAFAKLFFFFFNGRPYYSLLHNLFLLVLLPIYLFALKGSRSKTVFSPAKYFMVAFILVQAAIVMLTVEDWDGRFLVPVLPFIFIFTAIGCRDMLPKQY